jgi:AcrR family transcriptional regulator
MAKRGITRQRLTREDWINAAIDRLVANGVDGVRIDPLADTMKVSRGSFYWHFKNRRELLDAVLSSWREHQTQRIMERIRRDQNLAPIERLVRLRMLPPRTRTTAEAAAFELAVRTWALRDKAVRRVVDQVDSERVNFTAGLLADATMPENEAGYWALIGYAYTVGESLLRANMGDEQIIECRSRLLETQLKHFRQPTKEDLRSLRRRLTADAISKGK